MENPQLNKALNEYVAKVKGQIIWITINTINNPPTIKPYLSPDGSKEQNRKKIKANIEKIAKNFGKYIVIC